MERIHYENGSNELNLSRYIDNQTHSRFFDKGDISTCIQLFEKYKLLFRIYFNLKNVCDDFVKTLKIQL